MVTASFPFTSCAWLLLQSSIWRSWAWGRQEGPASLFPFHQCSPPASPSEGGSLSFSCLAPLPFQSCAFLSPGHQWNLADHLGVTTWAIVVPERNPSGCKIGGQAGAVDQAGLSHVSLALHTLYWLGRQAGDVAPVGHFHAPPQDWSAFCFLSTAEPKSVCVWGGFTAKEAKGHPFVLSWENAGLLSKEVKCQE